MESTNVREIKKAIQMQAYRGTRRVHVADQTRVINARTKKGQLQAKLMSGKWIDVESVSINYR